MVWTWGLNRQTCAVFVEYITKEQVQNLAYALGRCKFLQFKLMEVLLGGRVHSGFYFNITSEMAKCVYVGRCYLYSNQLVLMLMALRECEFGW